MIIKNVRLKHDEQATVLSARCKIRKIGWDTVYFRIDSAKHDYVYADASPFAAALLLPAMKQGEDLIIHGSISKQLYAGMQTIMSEVASWDIGMKPIKIKADTLVEDTHQPHKTATFFSGGVDSFYTYLKHRNDAVQADRIDSFIFVNNSFDIDPRNKELWDHSLQNIRAVATEEHIELVLVESNINTHELLAPIVSWDYIHGGCLAAVGLLLRRAYHKIYIPSTHSETQQIHWGTNLALDTHWSTETTHFLHDGTEATRLNKVIWQISKSPLALKHLRVCYKNTKGTYNCGTCDKCLRTMTNLYIAGALEKAETFPHQLDLDLIAKTPTINDEHGGPIFHNENLAALEARKLNPGLQKAIRASLDRTKATKSSRLDKLRDKVTYLDHNYTHGYVYSILSSFFGKKFA